VVRAYFTAEQRARYAGRLRATAIWLHCAGDTEAAGLAAQAAADLEGRALTRSRFALALAVRSALRAVQGPEIIGASAASPQ
jgi:hypothetical protein